MKRSLCSAIALLSVVLTLPLKAAIFTFEFEADGSLPADNVFGTLSGRIVGISESDPIADAIFVDAFPSEFSAFLTPGFDVLQQIGGVVENNFTVSGNTITAANFSFIGARIDFCLSAGVGLACGLNFSELNIVGPGPRGGNDKGFAGVTFNFVDPNPPVGVSEPRGILVWLTGLFVLFLVGQIGSRRGDIGVMQAG